MRRAIIFERPDGSEKPFHEKIFLALLYGLWTLRLPLECACQSESYYWLPAKDRLLLWDAAIQRPGNANRRSLLDAGLAGEHDCWH